MTGLCFHGGYRHEVCEGDEVIGMQMASQGECLLVVSENGYGKRTPIDEFTAQNRGGKGVRCYKIIDKTGDLVGAKLVDNERKIMLITNEGIIIKMAVSDISIIGRNTSGVKLMSIDAESGIAVASIAKVRESDKDEDEERRISGGTRTEKKPNLRIRKMSWLNCNE